MSRFRVPVGAYLTLVFLSGVLVGGFGVQLYNVRTVRAERPEEVRRQYLNEMNQRLHLQSAQRGRIEAILDQTRARFHEIHKQIDPQLKELKQEQRQKVRALLDPAQQSEYDRWNASRDKAQK